MRQRHIAVLILMLLATFWLAVSSLVDDSPTIDEQNHIARGIALLRTGDARLSLEHPPLINAWSALPLLSLPDLRLPVDDASWEVPEGWYTFASKLLWEYNPARVNEIIFLARIPIVLLHLMMAAVGYQFAQSLWHRRAGLVAACLLLFDPNILAHARYSTTDLGGSALLLLATFALWRLFFRPNFHLPTLLLTALALGMAFASKLSILGFVPIFALVALLPIYGSGWTIRHGLRRLTLYLTAGLLSIVVVWAIFGFEWGTFTFSSEPFTALNGSQGPLPTYFAGIEQIVATTGVGRASFLLGEFSAEGFPLYFPIAFLVKTPLTSLFLLLAATLYLLNRGNLRGRAFFLLIPALIYFGTTTRSGLNIGYRHLMPMLVLLYIMIAGITPQTLRREGLLTLRSFIVLFGVVGHLFNSLVTYPNYVGYFNPIVGSENGWQVLGDSNVDWGQDLVRLQRWMDQNGVPSVRLSYFGSAEPSRYVTHTPLPSFPNHYRDLWENVPFNTSAPEPGVYAISVENLHEMHHIAIENKTVFEYFREADPTTRVGSFNVYTIVAE